VGSAVDEPSGVESDSVSEEGGGVESDQGILSPEVDRHSRWHQKAEEDHKREIILPLEGQDRIRCEVGHVKL